MRPTDYLARCGQRLLAHGYEPVPIAPGKKFPLLDGWQSCGVSPQTIERWLTVGCELKRRDGTTYMRDAKHDGVGIRTARTPAIDIDSLDPAVADRMEAWCHAHFGFAPSRVGRAPKRLLVYRAEQVFPKQATVWLDADGQEQRLEVLAEGQQFVAWAIHPGTGKPYRWSADHLINTPWSDLPLLTADDARAACAEFDRLALEAGWTRKTSALVPLAGGDDDDMWATVQPGVEIEDDELRTLLMAIPDYDTYETWVHVGMALHHHYDGAGDGLEMWREWSAQSSKAVEDDTLDAKWDSFSERGARAGKTARYIILLGHAAQKAQRSHVIADLKQRLLTAGSIEALKAAADAASRVTMDNLDRESLCGAVKATWKRLESGTISIGVVRGMLRYRAPEASGAMPRWMEGWVYLTHSDTFYSKDTGEEVSKLGFDAKYDRLMLSAAEREAGKALPEVRASDAALRTWRIKTVTNRIYLPGEADEFNLNGLDYVNAYRDTLVPLVPATLRGRDRLNVDIVKAHFEHLFADERERAILLSFFAYVVQTGLRVGWAVLIQGTEGDGKTFLCELMAAILGGDNVKTIQARTMETAFTGWSEGSQMAFVEEVKLQGANRHDVLNSIKDRITNGMIEVHRKGRDTYQAPNTQSYILLTNFTDALPLGEGDSRYFVLRSRFQTQSALLAFKRSDPTYYDHLFNAVSESAGALRGWLLTYPLHEEFDPKHRAPWSAGRDYMAQMAASSEHEALMSVLRDSLRMDVRPDMLIQEALAEAVEEQTGDILSPWSVRRLLLAAGWTFLGRYSIGGQNRKVWTQSPERYQTLGVAGYDRAKLQSRFEGLDL